MCFRKKKKGSRQVKRKISPMPPKAQSKSKQGSAMKLLTAQEQEALKLRTERETESEILRRNVEASILMEKTAKDISKKKGHTDIPKKESKAKRKRELCTEEEQTVALEDMLHKVEPEHEERRVHLQKILELRKKASAPRALKTKPSSVKPSGDIEFSISTQSKRRKRKAKPKAKEKPVDAAPAPDKSIVKKDGSTEKESTEQDNEDDKGAEADTEAPNNEEELNDSIENAELDDKNFMFKHQEIVMVCHEMLTDTDIKLYMEGESPAQQEYIKEMDPKVSSVQWDPFRDLNDMEGEVERFIFSCSNLRRCSYMSNTLTQPNEDKPRHIPENKPVVTFDKKFFSLDDFVTPLDVRDSDYSAHSQKKSKKSKRKSKKKKKGDDQTLITQQSYTENVVTPSPTPKLSKEAIHSKKELRHSKKELKEAKDHKDQNQKHSKKELKDQKEHRDHKEKKEDIKMAKDHRDIKEEVTQEKFDKTEKKEKNEKHDKHRHSNKELKKTKEHRDTKEEVSHERFDKNEKWDKLEKEKHRLSKEELKHSAKNDNSARSKKVQK